MEDNISNYQNRNSIIRKFERLLLIFLLFGAIPLSALGCIVLLSPKILNSLPTLLSITALIQLEICGLFGYLDYFGAELEKIHEESECTPSNLVRPLYEFYNPE